MYFIGTRGSERVSGAEAVVRGLAGDGGLFVPEFFPVISQEELEGMLGMDYAERAGLVISKYFDEYDGEALLSALKTAYSRFEGGDAAPLVRLDEGTYILELFHGPTCAFKDMALVVLPHLLRKGCELLGIQENILVLAATSGDTGKAALEGFKNAEGIKIQVFYPNEGVSSMQRMQMCTQEGENVSVVAVKGNFDDCQTGVKNIFGSEECRAKTKERGYLLSSANSINVGRLIPQVAYYFSAYCDLVSSDQIAMGDKVDFAVPTGNFGNILAAYYAKRMGLPVGRLICASNKNNVLTDFFRTGNYDSRRSFYRTMSPSMDILVSSNLGYERGVAVAAHGVLRGLHGRGRHRGLHLRILYRIRLPHGYAHGRGAQRCRAVSGKARAARSRIPYGGGFHGKPVQVPAGRFIRAFGQRRQRQLQVYQTNQSAYGDEGARSH